MILLKLVFLFFWFLFFWVFFFFLVFVVVVVVVFEAKQIWHLKEIYLINLFYDLTCASFIFQQHMMSYIFYFALYAHIISQECTVDMSEISNVVENNGIYLSLIIPNM